jgi:hypothetical protein
VRLQLFGRSPEADFPTPTLNNASFYGAHALNADFTGAAGTGVASGKYAIHSLNWRDFTGTPESLMAYMLATAARTMI